MTQDEAVKELIPQGITCEDLSGVSAQALAELTELASFKAKCRIVACGNFEEEPGKDLASQNVDADTLRYLVLAIESGLVLHLIFLRLS